MLERDSELWSLDGALRGARASRGCTVLIEGPAGIGKTTLLAAAVEAADNSGMAVARSSAYEHASDALGLAIDLFEQCGGVDSTGGGLDGDFDPIEALHRDIAELADAQPLLLIVDDVHWVDSGSLSVLERLAAEVVDLPICLAAGLRTGEPQSNRVREGLLAGGEAEHLILEPLTAVATHSVVREQLRGATDALCASVSHACGGNPFLLWELLRSLREEDLGPAADPEQIQRITPAAVGELASRWLERLSREGRRLALALAVIGRANDLDLAIACAGLDSGQGSAALTELISLDLLDEEALAIRHPLIARALVEGASEKTIRSTRLRSARSLAERELEHRAGTHLHAAGDLEILATEAWAFDAILVAASRTATRGDPDRAIAMLDHALAAKLEPTERVAALRERGRIRSRRRDPSALDDLTEAIGLCRDPVERARIELLLGRARFYVVQLEASAEGCRQAIEDLDGADRELALLLEAEALNADRLRGARTGSAQLSRDVRSASSPGERAAAAQLAAEAVAAGDGSASEVAELALRSWRDGALLIEAGADAPVISFLGTTLSWCEEFERTLEVTDAQLDAGRRRHSPVIVSYALALRGGTRLRMGDLAQAEADAEQVVSALPASDPLAHMISFGWLLEVLIARGRPEEADSKLQASGLTGELPDLGTVHFLQISRGDTHLANGRTEAALEDYLEVGRRAERSGYHNPAGLAWRSRAARCLVNLGEVGRARDLAEEELAIARDFGAPRALGIALRARALSAADGERIGILEEAVSLLDDSRARLQRAHALHDLGRARLAAGAAVQAGAALERAMDEAHRCGAEPLVEAAMDGLRAIGRRPRRPAIRGVDALTPQQLRVAQLAAEGSSNPQIAAALFLNRRTVELHLTGAYRKLGIDSREQLAGVLADGAAF